MDETPSAVMFPSMHADMRQDEAQDVFQLYQAHPPPKGPAQSPKNTIQNNL